MLTIHHIGGVTIMKKLPVNPEEKSLFNEKFSNWFRSLRKSSKPKLNQSECAEIFNVDATTIAKWESGKACPDFRTIVEIARHFNASIDETFLFDHLPHDNRQKMVIDSGEKGNYFIESDPAVITALRTIYKSKLHSVFARVIKSNTFSDFLKSLKSIDTENNSLRMENDYLQRKLKSRDQSTVPANGSTASTI